MQPTIVEKLDKMDGAFRRAVADLREMLEVRASYDRFKEDQITKLHAELQEYKADFLSKITRPLLLAIIKLHDDIGRLTDGVRKKPKEALTVDQLMEMIGGIQEDVEVLLQQSGVVAFRGNGEAFDPARQSAARVTPAPSADLLGRVAERLRPGFEQGATILQKERVVVYGAPAPRPSNSNGTSAFETADAQPEKETQP